MNDSNSTISSLFDVTFVTNINSITLQVTRYFSIIIFIFGSIGNILNILILSQRIFRLNPCALHFLSASIANFVVIISGLLSRILSGWAADLTATNRFFCKLRGFIVNTARPIAVWYILFAMIDRWLLSSPKLSRRQMSSLKNAQRAIIVSLILSAMIFSHVIYCHEPNRIDAPQKCYGVTTDCRLATDTLFTTLTTVPLPLMLIFGLMTIYNIRQSKKRVVQMDTSIIITAMTNQANQRGGLSKQDHSLLIMLLIQICTLLILSVPLSFQKLYSSIADERPSLPVQYAIDNLVYNVAQSLHFLSNGMPFYIYTLAGGNIFRKTLIKFFVKVRTPSINRTR